MDRPVHNVIMQRRTMHALTALQDTVVQSVIEDI